MAEYKVEAGQIGAYEKVLSASTVDTVVFEERVTTVRIISDGTAAIYFTTNGTAPTVKGQADFQVPKGALTFTEEITEGAGTTLTVKLISEGTPTYSVETAQAEHSA